MTRDDTQYDTLPPAIIDALRELDGPAVLPDAGRDADVLSGARRHLAQTHRRRRNWKLFAVGSAGGALAAAAVVGVVVYLGDGSIGLNEPAADMAAQAIPKALSNGYADSDADPREDRPEAAPPGDLNGDDRVDILDAYALARQLEAGGPTHGLDLDADGRVDQRDVDWIARRAVALHAGEQG